MSEASKAWVDATLPLLSAIEDAGLRDSIDIDSLFRVPGDAKFYVDVMTDLSSSSVDEQVAPLYRPTAPTEGVVDALAAGLTGSDVGPTDSRVLRQLVKVPAEWPWGVLVTAAADALQVPNDIADAQLSACLAVLFTLEEVEPDAATALTKTVQDGFILHHVQAARSSKDFRATALCVLAHLRASPDGEIGTAVGNAAQGQQWYRTFAESPDSVDDPVIQFLASAVREFWEGRKLLVTGSDSNVAAPIVARVVERLQADDQFEQFVPAQTVVQTFPFLEAHLGPKLDSVLEAANQKGALVAELVGTPFESTLCGLYEWGLGQEATRGDVLPYVETGLADIPRDQWLSELTNAGRLLNLVVRMPQLGRAPLSWPFQDALIDEARAVVEKEDAFNGDFHRGNLSQALAEEAQGVFYKNLRDALVDNASHPLTAALAEYGNELDRSNALDDPSTADRVVRRVLLEIVDRQVGDELHWAVDVVEHHPTLMASCESATADLIRNRLRAAIESPRDGSQAPYLTTLATALGVEASGPSEADPD